MEVVLYTATLGDNTYSAAAPFPQWDVSDMAHSDLEAIGNRLLRGFYVWLRLENFQYLIEIIDIRDRQAMLGHIIGSKIINPNHALMQKKQPRLEHNQFALFGLEHVQAVAAQDEGMDGYERFYDRDGQVYTELPDLGQCLRERLQKYLMQFRLDNANKPPTRKL